MGYGVTSIQFSDLEMRIDKDAYAFPAFGEAEIDADGEVVAISLEVTRHGKIHRNHYDVPFRNSPVHSLSDRLIRVLADEIQEQLSEEILEALADFEESKYIREPIAAE